MLAARRLRADPQHPLAVCQRESRSQEDECCREPAAQGPLQAKQTYDVAPEGMRGQAVADEDGEGHAHEDRA